MKGNYRTEDKNRPELVCIVKGGGNIIRVFEKRHSLEEIYLSPVREEEEMRA